MPKLLSYEQPAKFPEHFFCGDPFSFEGLLASVDSERPDNLLKELRQTGVAASRMKNTVAEIKRNIQRLQEVRRLLVPEYLEQIQTLSPLGHTFSKRDAPDFLAGAKSSAKQRGVSGGFLINPPAAVKQPS